MGRCVFSQSWLTNSEFPWVGPASDGSRYRARCSLCAKDFDISNMGEAALKSHAVGKKHVQLTKCAQKSTPALTMCDFLEPITSPGRTDGIQPKSMGCSAPSSSVDLLPRSFSGDADLTKTTGDINAVKSQQQTLDSSCTKNDVLTAEVYWSLFAMGKHFSYNSFEGVNDIFKKMFPTCSAAQKFSCSETKARYLSTFGLAPYFLDLLTSQVRSSNDYVLLFDESLNHQLQKKQLDVFVRFWSDNCVKTRFFASRFLGHATAHLLYNELEDCCSHIGKTGLVQLSMDGPNVNWTTFKRLASNIETETDKKLINIGSCGLHTIHNAFKCAISKTGWDIEHAINSVYWLFKDSPARREDFVDATGCTIFPKQFCKHRWLENVSVCERLLEIWPSVMKFVDVLKTKKKCPQTKSFSDVLSNTSDLLFPVKLNIIISIAKDVEPFLQKYQGDKPLLPFLADDIQNMILKLLYRFVKHEFTKDIKTVSELFEITKDLSEIKIHKESAKIECGFIAERMLKDLKQQKQLSEKALFAVRIETKKMLIEMSTRLLEKSPLKYGFVRCLGWLNPAFIRKDKSSALEHLKKCLNHLVDLKHIDQAKCDDIINNYRDFAAEAVGDSSFQCFQDDKDRLDTLFFSLLAGRKEWHDLWLVCKKVLTLSHGQASVERGFSINKEIMTDNMKQKTLTAQRIITDHLKEVGGASNVIINKSLLYNAASGRSRYEQYLEDEKKKAKAEAAGLKRKELLDEIEELKAKKKKVEVCTMDLLKSADEYAEKAEHTQNFSFIAKSNALRKSAKDKEKEVSKLDETLNEKLEALKQ